PLGAGLPPDEARLLEALDDEPASLDVLASRAGLNAAKVSGALTLLELKGLARALPGGRFVRRRPRG
ncbi:MAG: DNA-protecting protein DprA, partial [Planctomycetes bacterium]|nr:DNA-protecting protein DprA [Planctomycetota bacterium]